MTLRVKLGWQKFCPMPFQCDVAMSDTLTHFLRMTFFFGSNALCFCSVK
jgi:hypothetical protein